MMIHYITIGFGGAIGAIARVAIGKILPSTVIGGIPFPIMFVNIVGCFLIGLLTEIMALHCSPSENIKYLLISGFLGGFTTFSTFALEFGVLVEKNELMHAMFYALLSFTLSIICFFIGIKIVRMF